jgi:prolyl-tRNA editing enzyme YbaK/EbsC (Cys-tRNA(Pro) deacylase)
MKLGTLELVPVGNDPTLLAAPVLDGVSKLNAEQVYVASIDPSLSDTAGFCSHYGVGMEQAANCVILEAKRADKSWFVACVVLGNMRADINGLVRRTLDARKVSFAPMEEAVKISGMEFGAITPIGLPSDWAILIDKAVADSAHVIVGSGFRKSKLAVPGSIFSEIPNAQIIEGLAKIPAPLIN